MDIGITIKQTIKRTTCQIRAAMRNTTRKTEARGPASAFTLLKKDAFHTAHRRDSHNFVAHHSLKAMPAGHRAAQQGLWRDRHQQITQARAKYFLRMSPQMRQTDLHTARQSNQQEHNPCKTRHKESAETPLLSSRISPVLKHRDMPHGHRHHN